jgi:hypothetical protein
MDLSGSGVSFSQHVGQVFHSNLPCVFDISNVIELSNLFHPVFGIDGLGLNDFSHRLDLLHGTVDLMGTQGEGFDTFVEELLRVFNKGDSVVSDY